MSIVPAALGSTRFLLVVLGVACLAVPLGAQVLQIEFDLLEHAGIAPCTSLW